MFPRSFLKQNIYLMLTSKKFFIILFFLITSFFVAAQTVPPSNIQVAVLSPRGGEVWYQGNSYNIRWSVSNLPDGVDAYIKIYLVDAYHPNRVINLFSDETINPRETQEKTFFISENINPGTYRIRVALEIPGSRTYSAISERPFSIERKPDVNNFDVIVNLKNPYGYNYYSQQPSFMAGSVMRIEWYLYNFTAVQLNRLKLSIYLVDPFNIKTEIKNFQKSPSSVYYYDWRIPNDIRKDNYRIELVFDLDGMNIYGVSDTFFINSSNTSLPNNIQQILNFVQNGIPQDITEMNLSLMYSTVTVDKVIAGKVYPIKWNSTVNNAFVDIVLLNGQGMRIPIARNVYAGSGQYNWQVPFNIPLGRYEIAIFDSAVPSQRISYSYSDTNYNYNIDLISSNYAAFSRNFTYPSSTEIVFNTSTDVEIGEFIINTPYQLYGTNRYGPLIIDKIGFMYSNLSNSRLDPFYNFSLWKTVVRDGTTTKERIGSIVASKDYWNYITFSKLNLSASTNSSIILTLKARLKSDASINSIHRFSPAVINSRGGLLLRTTFVKDAFQTVKIVQRLMPSLRVDFPRNNNTFVDNGSSFNIPFVVENVPRGYYVIILKQELLTEKGPLSEFIVDVLYRNIGNNLRDNFVWSPVVLPVPDFLDYSVSEISDNYTSYIPTDINFRGYSGFSSSNYQMQALLFKVPDDLRQNNAESLATFLREVKSRISDSDIPIEYFISKGLEFITSSNKYNFTINSRDNRRIYLYPLVPRGQPVLNIGSTYTIRWISSNNIRHQKVRIFLEHLPQNDDYGSDFNRLFYITTTVNNGSYEWRITNNEIIRSGEKYRFLIFTPISIKENISNPFDFIVTNDIKKMIDLESAYGGFSNEFIISNPTQPPEPPISATPTLNWLGYNFQAVPATLWGETRYGQWSTSSEGLSQNEISYFHFRLLTPITSTSRFERLNPGDNFIMRTYLRIVEGTEAGLCGFVNTNGDGYCLTLGFGSGNNYTLSLYSNGDQNPSYLGPKLMPIEVAPNRLYILEIAFVGDLVMGRAMLNDQMTTYEKERNRPWVILSGVSKPSFGGIYTYNSKVKFYDFSITKINSIRDLINFNIIAPSLNSIWYKNATQTVRWSSPKLAEDELLEIALWGGYDRHRILVKQTSNDGTEDIFIPASLENGRYSLVFTLNGKSLRSNFVDYITSWESSEFIITSTPPSTTTPPSVSATPTLNWLGYNFQAVPATLWGETRYGMWNLVTSTTSTDTYLRQSDASYFHHRIFTSIPSTINTLSDSFIIRTKLRIIQGNEAGVCGFVNVNGDGYCLTLGGFGINNGNNYAFSLYADKDQNPSSLPPRPMFIELDRNVDYELEIAFVSDVVLGRVRTSGDIRDTNPWLILRGISKPSFAGIYTYKSQVEFYDFSITKINSIRDLINFNITTPISGTTWYKNATQTVRWSSSKLAEDELLEISLQDDSGSRIILVTSTPNDSNESILIPSDVRDGEYRLSFRLWGKVFNSSVDEYVYSWESSKFFVRSPSTLRFQFQQSQAANISDLIEIVDRILKYLKIK
ncbi:MAG: hypothetical protein KatS3mg097_578 [Candidatus Parcubacteria bacterium]|nr:MAG: hypothetical protein KatS3mg097_578 [Candidatus Parcubacteria bacterium]